MAFKLDTQQAMKRRQTDLDKETKYGITEFASSFLRIADSLEWAARCVKPEDPAEDKELRGMSDGVRRRQKVVDEALHKFGIDKMKAEGVVFDPTKHEAVLDVELPGKEAHTIFLVMESGYTNHGRQVRASRVMRGPCPVRDWPAGARPGERPWARPLCGTEASVVRISEKLACVRNAERAMATKVAAVSTLTNALNDGTSDVCQAEEDVNTIVSQAPGLLVCSAGTTHREADPLLEVRGYWETLPLERFGPIMLTVDGSMIDPWLHVQEARCLLSLHLNDEETTCGDVGNGKMRTAREITLDIQDKLSRRVPDDSNSSGSVSCMSCIECSEPCTGGICGRCEAALEAESRTLFQ